MSVGSNIIFNGNNTTIVGSNAKVTGNGNIVTGSNARVNGNGNTVTGSNATIMGDNNRGTGSNAILYGRNNTWTGSNCKNYGVKTKYVEGPIINDIAHDVEAKEGADICCVCLTNRPICIVLPCAHACMCVSCARTVCFSGEDAAPRERGSVKCPKCRNVVKQVKRIY